MIALRHLSRRLLLAAIATATAVVPARAQEAPPPSSPPPATAPQSVELEPIPAVDLEGLEAAVATALREVVAATEQTLAQADLDAATAAEAFGLLGLRYDAYGFAEAAGAAYRNAARIVPGDYRWPYALGYLYHRQSRLDPAVSGYVAALDRKPDFVPAMLRLGEILRTRNDLEAAAELARRALATAPDEPAAHVLAGETALAAERWDDAVRHLEAALAAVPEADRLHYPLALAYRERGDERRAREHLERRGVIGVAPADPLAAQIEATVAGERVHMLRGRRAFAAGDYAAAVAAFASAVDAEPESVPARINLAAALEAAGDPDRALAQLEVAERLAPGNLTLLFNLGVTLARRGDGEGAAARLRRFLAERPDDAEAWARLADAELLRGDRAAAADAARRAAEVAPADVAIQADAGELLQAAGEPTEARERLETARRVLVGEPRLELALARILLAGEAGDVQRAYDLAAAVYAGERSANAALVAAAAAAGLGRCGDAAAWQRRAATAVDDASLRERFEAEAAEYERRAGEDGACRISEPPG